MAIIGSIGYHFSQDWPSAAVFELAGPKILSILYSVTSENTQTPENQDPSLSISERKGWIGSKAKNITDEEVVARNKEKEEQRKLRLAEMRARNKALRDNRMIRIKELKEKIRRGDELTPGEAEFFRQWHAPGRKRLPKYLLDDAAAQLALRPRSITELRLVIEQTAKECNYNPILELIQLTRSPDVSEKDKVAIHKALLPFIMPQLNGVKAQDADKGTKDSGVQVNVKTFRKVDTTDKNTPNSVKSAYMEMVESGRVAKKPSPMQIPTGQVPPAEQLPKFEGPKSLVAYPAVDMGPGPEHKTMMHALPLLDQKPVPPA